MPDPEPLDPQTLSGLRDSDLPEAPATEGLDPLDGWPGQDRALDAIRLAAQTGHSDFNLFVLGPTGSGRHSAARAMLEDAAGKRPTPRDWVYVNNFGNAQKPVALDLPPGRAEALRGAVERLIDDLANDIPALFESEDYQTRRRAIEDTFEEEQDTAMTALADSARARGVAILRTPMGFGVAALRDGEILTPEGYRDLPEDEKKRIDAAIAEVEGELESVLKQVPGRMKRQRQEVEELNMGLAEAGVDAAMAPLFQGFEGLDKVQRFLKAMRGDIIGNAELFLVHEDGARAGAFPVATTRHYEKPRFQRYTVNVMVSSQAGDAQGAPVVQESLPILSNLIGRIEYVSDQGALTTNFTMIRPGALHRANGGYLILDARHVLGEPFAWDALKRSLRTGEITIYSAGERLSMISTASLVPDPIPLTLRVVLIGDRLLYYMLVALDPEFSTLFKLEADFEDRMPREAGTARLFARLLASMQRDHGLLPVSADGVGRMMLEAVRRADDALRLSLDLAALSDLLREADHWARRRDAPAIAACDVETAIDAADRRAGRIRDLGQEAIARGTILIDADGARAGQINALSVLQIGQSRFGRPSRVTARVRVGTGKVVDIERETDLGGPLHSKGVMILSGYLAGQYAADMPMSLWASLVFEQSYGGVDGDSASAAELFALLSALSDLPIDQSFAVTGSVNQFGDIQPIGGVNEKIEGFFDVCAERGLTGRQGVLIPAANIDHLVLRPRVVQAASDGRFRVIPIATVDQGIAILTGCAAGMRGDDGAFPADSVNGLVEARLRGFAKTRLRLMRQAGGDTGSEP